MQPVEFVELPVAEHACSGHAGDACDRRHGSIGTHLIGRGSCPTRFKWRVLQQARLEVGEAAFGFTSRGKHRLQGLGLLIDFEFDEIHCAFERDGLGLQINLPCNPGAREVLKGDATVLLREQAAGGKASTRKNSSTSKATKTSAKGMAEAALNAGALERLARLKAWREIPGHPEFAAQHHPLPFANARFSSYAEAQEAHRAISRLQVDMTVWSTHDTAQQEILAASAPDNSFHASSAAKFKFGKRSRTAVTADRL